MKTSDILTELGKTIIDCRQVPRNVFDRYGEEVVDKEKPIYNRTFFKVNEHAEGTLCLFEAEKENYGIHAIISRKMHCPKTEFDEDSPLMVVYPFTRVNVGFLGETLKRAACYEIAGIKDIINYGYISGEPLIEIGRNEHFEPEINRIEKKMGGIVVEAPNKMKIIPALPREDAEELLNRFKGLLNYYKEMKVAEPAKI